jgi:hypothetical protein
MRTLSAARSGSDSMAELQSCDILRRSYYYLEFPSMRISWVIALPGLRFGKRFAALEIGWKWAKSAIF